METISPGRGEKMAMNSPRMKKMILKLLLLLIFLGITMIWIVAPTKVYRQHWLPKIRAKANTSYFEAQGATILDFTFPMLLVATLGCVYLHLGKKSEDGEMDSSSGKIYGLSAWKRPFSVNSPLGVVSWIEMAFVIMFLALLIWSFGSYLQMGFSQITRQSARDVYGEKVWEARLDIAALRLGNVGNICLAFLFFPVTRGSSVLPLLGLTSESSIKYHIWLGHITMVLFTAHGVLYVVLWGITHQLSEFYEQLVDGEDSGGKHAVIHNKPLNKVIKFSDSDASGDDDESGELKEKDANNKNQTNGVGGDTSIEKQHLETAAEQKEEARSLETAAKQEVDANLEDQKIESETSAKKQRLETSAVSEVVNDEPETKSIDKLIEDELKELKDRCKRRFVSLDSGCNGIVFVQMHKRDGDPDPAEIVKHMMTSAAATRKHMSRFILRILPVQLTCYASEEEISKAVKPLIDQHFPAEAETPLKFAVLYDVRANTGIDRMAIIKAVADCVPAPHKVDLNNPDKSIIVQIAKTVCSIGVVEKYKELSKYNLRQLTSPKP